MPAAWFWRIQCRRRHCYPVRHRLLVRTMPSPAKKRKLHPGNGSTTGQTKGLEHYFASKSPAQGLSVSSPFGVDDAAGRESIQLTDEEFARKLQAEWNREIIADEGASTPGGTEAVAEIAGKSGGSSGEGKFAPASNSLPGDTTLSLQSTGMAEDAIISSIPLDEPALSFEPSQHVPRLQQHWASEGGDASYALLTRCFVLVSGTTSRIKTVDILVNCLRLLVEGDLSSLLPAVSSPGGGPDGPVLTRTGVACDKFHFAALSINGARAWWLGHFQGAQTSMRLRSSNSQGHI